MADTGALVSAGAVRKLSRIGKQGIPSAKDLEALAAFVSEEPEERKYREDTSKRERYNKQVPGTVAHIAHPTTGRPIRIFGQVFNKLQKEGKLDMSTGVFYMRPYQAVMSVAWSPESASKRLTDRVIAFEKRGVNRAQVGQARGRKTRGWGEIFPKSINPRRELYKKCGPECFLLPGPTPDSYHKFPICAALGKGEKDCQADCRGIAAAKQRAAPYSEYQDVKKLAAELQKALGCP